MSRLTVTMALCVSFSTMSCVQSRLFNAVEEHNIAKIQHLLHHGATLSCAGKDGNTPLHSAVLAGNRDVVAFIVAQGALLNAENKYAMTPLHYAADGMRPDLCGILLRAGADINKGNGDGLTALTLAIGSSSTATVKFLLDCGARVDNAYGKDSALHFIAAWDISRFIDHAKAPAPWSVNCAMAHLLLEYSPNIDARGDEGDTPLHSAIVSGARDVAAIFLDAGADVDAQDDEGRSPIFWAVEPFSYERRTNRRELCELLLKHGCDVFLTDKRGASPLMIADKYHEADILDVLRRRK